MYRTKQKAGRNRNTLTFKWDGDGIKVTAMSKKEKVLLAAELEIGHVLTVVEEGYYEGSLPCFPGRLS